MSVYVLVILSVFATISWASDYQPILTQISDENSECNKLLGGYNLETVPQFNALCNIPIPEQKQTEFLLVNNVVPILCMGLMDVSLRLCKSANNDITGFEDIFPPTSLKFSDTFLMLSKKKEFSSLDEFCSTTVNKFAIHEAASNVTKLWWEVLNKQLSDSKTCTYICRSNDGSKVHPLCSYILWSNGIYINYQNNQRADGKGTTLGESQEPPTVPVIDKVTAVDQPAKTNQNISLVNKELAVEPKKVVSLPDIAPSLGEKFDIGEGFKSSFTTDNNVVGVGTVEQIIPGGDETSNTGKIITNPNMDEVKVMKKGKLKIKQLATTLKPPISGSPKLEAIGIQEKPVLTSDQAEVKVNTNSNTTIMPSDHPGLQGNAQGSDLVVPESLKPDEPKQGPEMGKEGLVEGDPSLEMTPDAFSQDQPVASDNFLPLSDGDEENGDGDDLNIEETNVANNSSKPVGSKDVEASIQQGFQDGDKGYGEGEILIEDHFIEAEDSHFFTYFLCMAVLTIMAYLAFHNKKKLIALAVEGRRTKGGRRRPNSSHYSKLDCSLEEALVSNTTASVTHVLY